MKSRAGEIALLVGAAIVLGVLAYGRHRAEQRPPPSVYSTYDTGPNGYRALYEVLRSARVPVQRFTRTLGLLDRSVRTLVLSNFEFDPSAKAMDSRDGILLRDFVRGGGRLVVLDWDFVGSRDLTPGVPTSKAAKAGGAIALARNRYTTGVSRVSAPVAAVFPFSERNGIPLLANSSGIVAISYRYGKGEVVAITAPALFANKTLRAADNLAFAYNAVAGHGPAAFDEYVHGYDDDAGFWQALPAPVHAAVWIVVAIVVLAIIGANVPWAPPVPAEPPDERDSSAYLDAMASLMRRARAAHAAIAAFGAGVRRRPRQIEANPGLRDAMAELQTLQRAANPSEAMVVRAAVLDFHIRKDYA